MKTKRIILMGAGNVATHLASALLGAGFNLCQIYSRTLESARELGKRTGISYTSDIYSVYPDADIYLFSVSDMALVPLVRSMKINPDALLIHTAGSLPLDVFRPFARNYGVLYPLQTFSKKRMLDFRSVPLCIEANNSQTLALLQAIGAELSDCVREVSTSQRKTVHLAAVFANNFSNHLYALSENLMREHGMDFDMLRPLIMETADKVQRFTPQDAQTGPARRDDVNVMNMHRKELKNMPEMLAIYDMMSKSIHDYVRSDKVESVSGDDKQLKLEF